MFGYKNGDLTCTKKINLLTARTHGKVLMKFANIINVDTRVLVVCTFIYGLANETFSQNALFFFQRHKNVCWKASNK
jgi:hypothetical protein